MATDPNLLLSDMLDRAEYLIGYVSDKRPEILYQDRMVRSSIERELAIISEVLGQLHQENPALAMRIEHWRKMIRFHQILVHSYSKVKLEALWDVIEQDLPPLVAQIKQLKRELAE